MRARGASSYHPQRPTATPRASIRSRDLTPPLRFRGRFQNAGRSLARRPSRRVAGATTTWTGTGIGRGPGVRLAGSSTPSRAASGRCGAVPAWRSSPRRPSGGTLGCRALWKVALTPASRSRCMLALTFTAGCP